MTAHPISSGCAVKSSFNCGNSIRVPFRLCPRNVTNEASTRIFSRYVPSLMNTTTRSRLLAGMDATAALNGFEIPAAVGGDHDIGLRQIGDENGTCREKQREQNDPAIHAERITSSVLPDKEAIAGSANSPRTHHAAFVSAADSDAEPKNRSADVPVALDLGCKCGHRPPPHSFYTK